MRARKSPEPPQVAANAGVVKVVIVPGPEFVQIDQFIPAAVPCAFDDMCAVPLVGRVAVQSTMPPSTPVPLPPVPVLPTPLPPVPVVPALEPPDPTVPPRPVVPPAPVPLPPVPVVPPASPVPADPVVPAALPPEPVVPAVPLVPATPEPVPAVPFVPASPGIDDPAPPLEPTGSEPAHAASATAAKHDAATPNDLRDLRWGLIVIPIPVPRDADRGGINLAKRERSEDQSARRFVVGHCRSCAYGALLGRSVFHSVALDIK